MSYPIPDIHKTQHLSSGFDPGVLNYQLPVTYITEARPLLIDHTLWLASQKILGTGTVSSSSPQMIVHIKQRLRTNGWAIRKFEADQMLESGSVTRSDYSVTLGCGAYTLHKIDEAVVGDPGRLTAFANEVMAENERTKIQFCVAWLVGLMYAEADPANYGSNAGRYGSLNLGTLAAPITITVDTLGPTMALVQTLLEDGDVDLGTHLFALAPSYLRAIIYQMRNKLQATSLLDQAFQSIIPPNFFGFDFVFDNTGLLDMGMSTDAPPLPILSMLCGYSEATLFYATGIDHAYGPSQDVRVLHGFVRGLFSFGAKVIEPRGLARIVFKLALAPIAP